MVAKKTGKAIQKGKKLTPGTLTRKVPLTRTKLFRSGALARTLTTRKIDF
jgi:hypothetical protein